MDTLPPSAFNAALQALAENQPARALPLLHEAMAGAEAGPLAQLNLGIALMELGRLREAEVQLRHSLLALPLQPEPGVRLGRLLAMRGCVTEARAAFTAVLRQHPQHVPALAGLATLAEAVGEAETALALLERAAAIAPAELELLAMQAGLLLDQGRHAEAQRLAETLLEAGHNPVRAARQYCEAFLPLHGPAALASALAGRLQQAPDSAAWTLAHAAQLFHSGQVAAALAELRIAVALAPNNLDIRQELARRLFQHNHVEEALALCQAVLPHRPAELELHGLISTMLWRKQRFAEMVGFLEASIAQLGDFPLLHMNLSLALNAQGRQHQAMMHARAGAAASGNNANALVNLTAIAPYHPTEGSAAALHRHATAIGRALPAGSIAAPRARPARPRLRLGILSGGLGVHPVGWLTVAGLEALPEAEFELVAYSLKPRQDFINTRFRARSALWREVAGATDAEIAAAIRADNIDILLEMGGYGEGGRIFALQGRPAPLQVKWVGSQFGTTGLPFMDAMLTDGRETPPGSEPAYTEKLLRLPDGYVCYLPPPYAPPVAPLPMASRGHVTFGCFNNLAKITDEVLRCWATLLARLPSARLIIKTHALSDPGTLAFTRARLKALGLPAERVELRGGSPHRDMLASYNELDLALDPFPYTGGLTVCEALWMGVPVVALAGSSFAGRHALSHLGNTGLADWVAENPAAYVERAIQAASDPTALASLRQGLRRRVQHSPLCDAPRFGRHLGAALRRAWNG